jgi:hypothetical protein
VKRAPTIKRLCAELKDITTETAKAIRHIWCKASHTELLKIGAERGITTHHGYVEDWRYFRALIIDSITQSYGVEFLGIHRRTGQDVNYLNAGDTYAPTLVFQGDSMRIACCGDYVESNLVRQP